LIGSGIPVVLSSTVASLLKFIPVIGYTTASLSISIVGGASTYALGKVFVQHFESGGTFLDFDPMAVKEYFAKEFKEGQGLLSELSGSATR
ncbi:MAG: GTPase, partial [Nitrospirae bacterium]|nr:GTPase [Nitrospirota bacterium]